jgi:hypothetical protein
VEFLGLVELPNLKSIGFDDRRGYDITPDEAGGLLIRRSV